MNKQQALLEFHKAFNILINNTPTIPNKKIQKLRKDLIQEELDELVDAFEEENLVEVADALADLLYVVYGTAISCGIDIDPIFQVVHESNMSKVGGHMADNGKWIKPPTYHPPTEGIRDILDEQRGRNLVAERQ